MNKINTTIIAIDGTAASGKGTLAKKIATHFNYAHLDTGKLYRGLAYLVMSTNTDNNDIDKIISLIPDLHNLDFNNPELISTSVSKTASIVSALPPIRQQLLKYQKDFPVTSLQKGFAGVVVDGRDIGSIIFPDADIKFFVDADVETRARRRYNELINKENNIDYKSVLSDITQRDYADKTRKVAPLIICDDAIVIDTTNTDIEAMVENAINNINKLL